MRKGQNKLLMGGLILLAIGIAIKLASPKVGDNIRSGFGEGWRAAFKFVGVDKAERSK